LRSGKPTVKAQHWQCPLLVSVMVAICIATMADAHDQDHQVGAINVSSAASGLRSAGPVDAVRAAAALTDRLDCLLVRQFGQDRARPWHGSP